MKNSPQTGSLSILLKPFDYISNYLPPPKFFDGVLTQEEAMPPLFPNKFISTPPPSNKISQHLTFGRKIGPKNRFENSEALDRLHLSRDVFRPVSQFWEAGVFRHLRSLLLLPLSPSPSLKPQAPQDVSQPNVTDFLPPTFFLSHSIPGWTHSVWSWN